MMELFWKAAAATLLAVILCLCLSGQHKEMAVLLSLAACAMIAAIAVEYLEPVVEFLRSLRVIGQLDEDMVGIMLKAVGIGLVAELANLICSDAGNAALGRALQILAGGIVLWLSLPLFQRLMELLQTLLGAV